MKKSKFLLWLITVVTVISMLAACAPAATPTEAPKAEGKKALRNRRSSQNYGHPMVQCG